MGADGHKGIERLGWSCLGEVMWRDPSTKVLQKVHGKWDLKAKFILAQKLLEIHA